MVIDSVIMADEASHAGGLAKVPQGVLVYRVQLLNGEAAEAKIPSNVFLYHLEVRQKRQKPFSEIRELIATACTQRLSGRPYFCKFLAASSGERW